MNKESVKERTMRLVSGHLDARDLAATVELAESTTDPDILRKLADREEWDILNEVARNACTPDDTLEKLARHEISFIRAAVASNRAIPRKVQEMLSEDSDNIVLVALAPHAEYLSVIKRLMERARPSVFLISALKENPRIDNMPKSDVREFRKLAGGK